MFVDPTPRAQQQNTLQIFKDDGKFTIRALAEKLGVRTSSARSRIIRCFDNGWLSDKYVSGPTGDVRQFTLNKLGRTVLRTAKKN